MRFGQSNFRLEHVLNFAYINKAKESWGATVDDKGKSFKIVLRPSYQLTQYTRLLAEVGAYTATLKTRAGEKRNYQEQKYTIAYAIAPSAEILSRPELRFYATYMHAGHASSVSDGNRQIHWTYVNDDGKFTEGWSASGSKDNYNFGIQAEAWW